MNSKSFDILIHVLPM